MAGLLADEIAWLLRLEDGTHCEEASGPRRAQLKDAREDGRLGTHGGRAAPNWCACACHARKGNVSRPLIASLQRRNEARCIGARGVTGVTTP